MRGLPSLNALAAFEAAARLLSVRQAAAQLCVTPAAVSKQIRMLENHLGCALFIRKNQRIALTPHGANYLERIESALREIREATRELKLRDDKRTLKIRSYNTFSVYWLIPRLSDFYALYPGINIEISATSRWIDFEDEDVDAAVRLGDGHWPGLTAYRLMSNRLAPACSPHIADTLKKPADLARHTLLHALARPDDWAYWLDRFSPDTLDPHDGRHYESSVLVYQAATLGHGVAMAQLAMIKPDLDRKTLILPFTDVLDRGDFTYYLVVPEDRPITTDLGVLCEWLRGLD
jgi:LysR family glycine cleavage system transcriptional activator